VSIVCIVIFLKECGVSTVRKVNLLCEILGPHDGDGRLLFSPPDDAVGTLLRNVGKHVLNCTA
jgi:hypothetical protein